MFKALIMHNKIIKWDLRKKCTFATLGEKNWDKLTFTKTSGTVTTDRENFDQQSQGF